MALLYKQGPVLIRTMFKLTAGIIQSCYPHRTASYAEARFPIILTFCWQSSWYLRKMPLLIQAYFRFHIFHIQPDFRLLIFAQGCWAFPYSFLQLCFWVVSHMEFEWRLYFEIISLQRSDSVMKYNKKLLTGFILLTALFILPLSGLRTLFQGLKHYAKHLVVYGSLSVARLWGTFSQLFCLLLPFHLHSLYKRRFCSMQNLLVCFFQNITNSTVFIKYSGFKRLHELQTNKYLRKELCFSSKSCKVLHLTEKKNLRIHRVLKRHQSSSD